MAYVAPEVIEKVRASLKAKYPAKKGWKFSVTGVRTSSINVKVMKAPESAKLPELHMDINQYWIKENAESCGWSPEFVKLAEDMNEIVHVDHWDKSEIQTDYFHCSYYINIGVGKWNRDCEIVKGI